MSRDKYPDVPTIGDCWAVFKRLGFMKPNLPLDESLFPNAQLLIDMERERTALQAKVELQEWADTNNYHSKKHVGDKPVAESSRWLLVDSGHADRVIGEGFTRWEALASAKAQVDQWAKERAEKEATE